MSDLRGIRERLRAGAEAEQRLAELLRSNWRDEAYGKTNADRLQAFERYIERIIEVAPWPADSLIACACSGGWPVCHCQQAGIEYAIEFLRKVRDGESS